MTDSPKNKDDKELLEKDNSYELIKLQDEMKRSYMDYAMSVIVSRAIPDVRDGLKPVHRRILYSMYEGGYVSDKPYRKSARIVGDVIGKYHPHGDSAVYDALVRMAQEFSLRVPLVDGQGNFGSVDGDAPAAMRYTESRADKIASKLFEDIDKETVDFNPNYDGSEEEPSVLPAMFPNLLVNGTGGIAVGMATNVPPHNLGEVIDALCAYLDNEEITISDLVQHIKGPDFPTGGEILGYAGSLSAYNTGRGKIVYRGKTHIEERDNREAVIITEIPYMVNKARLLEKIADLVRNKKIEGISDLRDESNKDGIRVVIELKRDTQADILLNKLYSYTDLQTSFGVIMLALNDGMPKVMNLLEVIKSFALFRKEVITKRTIFLLNKARAKAHILLGGAIAVSNIDEVIAIIKSSKTTSEAKERLMEQDWDCSDIIDIINLIEEGNIITTGNKIKFSAEQAKAILEMKLQRLTAMEKNKIEEDLKCLVADIANYLEILGSKEKLIALFKEELIEIKDRFATPRRTVILEGEFSKDEEDLIAKEEMVVTMTHGGYIKRTMIDIYKSQRRGGKGKSGASVKEEDAITNILTANTHTELLFFSSIGQVYSMKLYKLPIGNLQSKGRPIVNLLPLAKDEFITNIMPMPNDDSLLSKMNIVFATKKGKIRKNSLADFTKIQTNGKIAIRLEDDDKLVNVAYCNEGDDIFLATRCAMAIRFSETALRVFKGRKSDGVRAIKLSDDDYVISMSVLSKSIKDEDNEEYILTIAENGLGKMTDPSQYRVTNRGGVGIANMSVSDKTGNVVASMPATKDDDLLLITGSGKMIRLSVSEIRTTGRNTSGVILFKTQESEKVVSVTLIKNQDKKDEDEEAEQGVESQGDKQVIDESNSEKLDDSDKLHDNEGD